MIETQLRGERLFGLAFEHFQQQRKLGDFDGLRVDVDAVNVLQQNPFPLGGCEFPLAARPLIKRWDFVQSQIFSGRCRLYQSRCQSSRY